MNEDKTFTLQDLLRWSAEITGKGLTSNRQLLLDLIRESIEALHNEESVLNFRAWEIPSEKGIITLPKEIDTPSKYRICEEIGPVRNLAYKFVGYRRNDVVGYREGLLFKSETPIFYDLPLQGGRLAAKAIDYFEAECDPDKRPYLLVQGKDMQNREIHTPYNDKMDVGERVFIAQPSEKPTYTQNVFKEITSVRVVNSHLNLAFVWCNVHNWGESPFEVGTLALYDAGDEYPTFRKYFVPGCGISSCFKVEVLGKLRLPKFKFDNELIHGFDSNTLRSMIRANYYRQTNDINGATFNSNIAMGSIRKSNEKETPNTDTLAINEKTSAGRFPGVW